MAFKSSTQPLCRYCGKGIRKHTDSVYFGSDTGAGGIRPTKPKTVAEAQAQINHGRIVAHRYHWTAAEIAEGRRRHGLYQEATPESNYIRLAHVWDGESYVDEFFCNGDHAQRFAYVMARTGAQTVAHQNAVKARKAVA